MNPSRRGPFPWLEGDAMMKGQKEATLLALEVEEAGHQPGMLGPLEVGKDKETDAPLEPPGRNAVQPTP